MEFENMYKPEHPIVDIDGFIAKGKQFDLDITLPIDNRNVIYGIIKDCYREPVKNAVVKLVEVDCKEGKKIRKPVSHTFTDEHGEFVFGPLCPEKEYAIDIWVDEVKHFKIRAKCDHEGKCLKGIDIDKCEHFEKESKDKYDYNKKDEEDKCRYQDEKKDYIKKCDCDKKDHLDKYDCDRKNYEDKYNCGRKEYEEKYDCDKKEEHKECECDKKEPIKNNCDKKDYMDKCEDNKKEHIDKCDCDKKEQMNKCNYFPRERMNKFDFYGRR